MAKSNINLLEHILKYCNEIKMTIDRFGDDINIFLNDIDYRKSISLSLLQIGELAGKLTEDYREATAEIPWRQIRGLRNIVAHAYGSIDFHDIFDIAHENINELSTFCETTLKLQTLISQEVTDDEDYDMEM